MWTKRNTLFVLAKGQKVRGVEETWLFQKNPFSWKKCTFSGMVYKSVVKSWFVQSKNYILREVHFFQGNRFFWNSLLDISGWSQGWCISIALWHMCVNDTACKSMSKQYQNRDQTVWRMYGHSEFPSCVLILRSEVWRWKCVADRSKWEAVSGHPYMTSTQFRDFFTPSPPCPHLGLICSTKFTQPPLLHLLLG